MNLSKEERIKLRDELIEIFIKNNIIKIPKNGGIKINKTNLNKLLNNNNQFKEKYELYINQFRSEDEAQFHIKHHTDIEDYLCPICGNIRAFYKKRKNLKYQKTCGDDRCIKKMLGSAESRLKARQTMEKEYGIDNVMKLQEFKDKAKETCVKKYGTEYAMQNEKIKNKMFQTKKERYGNSYYNNRSKARSTCLIIYGVDNPFKSKKIRNKIYNTNLKKYGTKYVLSCKEIRNKATQTSINKYGHKNYNNRLKAKQTLLKNYNVSCPFNSKIIQKRIIKTNLKRYNVKHVMQNAMIKQRQRDSYMKNHYSQDFINNKEIEKFLNKYNKIFNKNITKYDIYNIDIYFIRFIKHMYKIKKRLLKLNEIADIFKFWPTTIKYKIQKLKLLKYFDIKDSKLELQFKNFLENNDINHKRHNYYSNGNRNSHFEVDFMLEDYNIGFEINDIMTHNSKEKDKFYHINKTCQCIQKEIRLIHIWEWELTDKELWRNTSNWILNLLDNQKQEINVEKCVIKLVNKNDEKNFLNQYDLEGYKESQYCYGLHYNNELIQLLSFKQLENNNFELIKFCTKFEYHIENGVKELLNYFIQNYNINSIIAYQNNDKFTGKIFKELGFKLKERIEPQLIQQNDNITNSPYKLIYNCGQNVYILKIK